MANEIGIVVTAQNQATQVLSGATQQAEGFAGSVKGVGETAGGILAANTIQNLGQQVTSFASAAINAGDEILSTSQKMGVSTDALQEMRFWAEQGGVSAAGLERAVATLNQRIGEAAAGNNAYAQAFRTLGVEFTDAQGNIRSTESVLRETIGALREIEDPAARAAAASELFGSRLGRELLPALDESSMSMEEAARRAQELGIVLDEDGVRASDQFADSLAALQQTGSAILRDFMMPMVSAIGDGLLPTLTNVAAAFRVLPEPIQAVAGTIGALSLAALIAAPRIIATKAALDSMGTSARTAAARAGGILAVFTALATISAFLGEHIERAEIPTNLLAEDLQRLAESGRITGELLKVLDDNTESFAETIELAEVEADGLGGRLRDIFTRPSGSQNQVTDAAAAVRDLDAALADIAQNGGDAEGAFRALTDSQGLNEEQVATLLELLPQYREAQERATERTRDAAAATEEQVDALKALTDEVRAATNPLFAYERAQQGVRDAQVAVQEAIDQFGAGSSQHRNALEDLAAAELDFAGATIDAGEAITGTLVPDLRRMRDAGLISEEAFGTLLTMIERVDGQNVDVRVRDNAAQAAARARALQDSLDNIDRFIDVNIRYHSDGTGAAVGGLNALRASGGVVGSAATGGVRNNRVWVGEQGPELLDLPPGSMVHSNPDSMRMAGGGGPTIVHVHPSGNAAMDGLLRWVIEQLSNAIRTQAGGDPVIFFGGG